MSQYIETLRSSKLFEDLTDEELKTLLDYFDPVSFKKGDIIVEEGSSGDSLFVLIKGKVEVTRKLTLSTKEGFEEAEKAMTQITPDSPYNFFGEMSLIDGSPRSATVKATTQVELLEMRRHSFEKLLKKEKDIAIKFVLNIAKALSERIRNMTADILKLTTALSIALSNQ